MPNPPAHYLVVNQSDAVLGHAMRIEHAQYIADEQLFGQRSTRVVDLYKVDVATLARIVAVDFPGATAKGYGVLGAGTHPAQPYLEVMSQMRGVTRDVVPGLHFGPERVADIIEAFLGNSHGWRGDTARAVKATLRTMAAKR